MIYNYKELARAKIQNETSTGLKNKLMAVKKGEMVRVVREKFENSLEAKASDTRLPSYLFESQGEVLDIKGDYAFVKFGKVPTPNIWLRLEQLEAFS